MNSEPLTTEQGTTMFHIHLWKSEIEQKEVLRLTEHYVTFRDDFGGRPIERKEKRDGRWFATWGEAWAALVKQCEERVRASKDSLHRARTTLGQVQSMKEPK